MRYFLFLLSFVTASVISQSSFAQRNPDNVKPPKPTPKFGIKGGYNIAKMYGSTPSFKPGTKDGFMVAGYYSAGGGSGMGYRTELVFSRQGFSYDSTGKKINVKQDYIYMPQFTTFTVGKFLQFQLGAQLGLLVNAVKSVDSSGAKKTDIMDIYNKIDYGVAGGVEIYPVRSVVIGGRYSLSLGNMYKRQQTQSTMPYPLPFNPNEVKGKNGVISLYVGLRF
jgi:hypothetical protein